MNTPYDLIALVDVAPSFGVTPDAIKNALKRARKRVYKLNGRNAATIAELEWYGARRERKAPGVPARPAGWWGIKRAAAELGVDTTGLHYMVESKRVSAVRHAKHYYFDPAVIRQIAGQRQPVPSNWVPLVDLAREVNAQESTVKKIALRLRLSIRTFYATGLGRPGRQCVSRSDTRAIIAQLNVPHAYPGRLKTVALAEHLGIPVSRVRWWTKQGAPKVKCVHHYCWFDLAEVEAWLAERAA